LVSMFWQQVTRLKALIVYNSFKKSRRLAGRVNLFFYENLISC